MEKIYFKKHVFFKRFRGLLIIVMIGLFVSGCTTKPTYYSKSEVKEYVKDIFGSEYKLSDTLTYKDDTDEQNDVYEYVFSKEGEAPFSVYASTGHIGIDASTTSFYDKNIDNDYIKKILNINWIRFIKY